jgi:hypothetical protein
VLSILGIVALLAFKIGILGTIFPRDGDSDGGSTAKTGPGYWYLNFPTGQSTSFSIGAPVIADRHRIGSVVYVVRESSWVSLGFHIDTAYDSLVHSEPGFAVGPRDHRHLCFGTRAVCGEGSPAPPTLQLDPPPEAPQ